MFDIVIKNGKIMDGTGNPWFYADVGIKGDKVVKISNNIEPGSAKVIDAEGLAVAPGFIDMHAHSDLAYLVKPDESCKISQGITLEVCGLCAIGTAPVTAETKPVVESTLNPLFGAKKDFHYQWNTMGEYLDHLDKASYITNLAMLQGHNAIRSAAMGFENREPTKEELEKMKDFLREAFDAGVLGFSVAGVQSPSNFAKTDELVELCKVVAEYNGIFESHLRSESNSLLEAIAEVLHIGRVSGVKPQISHYKTAGKQNWGKIDAGLMMIEEARQNGIDVGVNQYPYTFATFNLEALLPLWVRGQSVEEMKKTLKDSESKKRILKEMQNGIPNSGWESVYQWCGWEGITIGHTSMPENQDTIGKNLLEIAIQRNVEPIDALCDIIAAEGLGVLMLLDFGCEEDVENALSYPFMAPGTDALLNHLSGGSNHPRVFGSFTKVLGYYARERKIMSMEEGIRRMTSLPATRLGIRDRGLLREGNFADVVVFNPGTVADTATRLNPRGISVGIEYVLVNGEVVWKDKKVTGALPGRLVRRSV